MLFEGGCQDTNIGWLSNNMTTFENADDIAYLTGVFGHFAYDFEKEAIYIPNITIRHIV